MTTLNISQIKQYLPHRYPFLFVDAVEEVIPGEIIRARKAVSGNEELFNGHFPGRPVFPGVLQIEAMGQAGCLLAILSGAEVDETTSIFVTTITDCKFRRPIVPGDVMELQAKVTRKRLGAWRFACEVHVDGTLASTATITAIAAPAPTDEKPEGLPEPIYPVS